MSTQEKVQMQISKKSPKYNLSTELFTKRADVIPAFIRDHKAFKTPTKVSKVFPSVGLKNFREPCELVKPLIDNKKDNFVSLLISVMNQGLSDARDAGQVVADEVQYIYKGDDRAQKLEKIEEIYNLVTITKNLSPQLDNYNNNYEKIIQNAEGKIALRLSQEVLDSKGKAVFKKNQSLFKVFASLKTQFEEQGVTFIDIDQTQEFKTFCVENVPNKKYEVVFSAEGEMGAWDILTMSMRGIKSCQRWDGDYPRCLIGSILSKYVGIIYITSGADFEGMGEKMMRRAVVRYAIDADENKPCIIIDRLYPQQQGADVDEETLKAFTKALSSKTSLPVHFAPNLGPKAKHFYVPFEKNRAEIPERDWSYQDSPLKTDLDFALNALLSSSNDDINRYVTAFRARLVTVMGENFRNILANRVAVRDDNHEIYKTIYNMNINGQIDYFSDKLTKTIFDRFSFSHQNVSIPKEQYRKYLTKFLLSLKTIKFQYQANINATIDACTSRAVNHKIFSDYVFAEIIKQACIKEIKSLLS